MHYQSKRNTLDYKDNKKNLINKRMRKEDLIKDGKFNLSAIMKRAWAYMNDPFCTRFRKDFKGALQESWLDARMKMDELKNPRTIQFNLNRTMAELRPNGRRNGFVYGI